MTEQRNSGLSVHLVTARRILDSLEQFSIAFYRTLTSTYNKMLTDILTDTRVHLHFS
jgi:hypothetical protein